MYLRAAKADLEAAGESTDGMAISTSKLRKSILALTKDRVDVMLDENTFKSTYQIIKEISQVWSSMADVDQAALLELLGGKRNANATASLIQNFDIAEQALKSATDSAGSAATENEKYLDSILGKVAQFNAAFETLSATVIDADFSKGVVDAGTTILDVINGLVDGLGTLNTLAIGVGAALSLGKVKSIFSPIQFGVEATAGGGDYTKGFSIGFSSQLSRDKAGIKAYNEALDEYVKKCVAAKGSTEDYAAANAQLNEAATKAMTAVSASTRKMIEAHKETLSAKKVADKAAQNKKEGKSENDGIPLNASTESLLNFRLKTIAATVATTALNMAISAGISLAIQGLDYLIHRGERLTEAAEKAKAAVDSISGELDELKSSTDSAKTTLSAFGDQVKYVNGRLTSDSLSTEQIEQYSEAVKTLTDQYPELIAGYDAEGNAIVNLSGGYGTLTAKINEAYKAKLALANAELDEKMPDIVKGMSELRTERGQYSTTQSYYAEDTDEYQDYQKKIEAVDAKIRAKWREINQSLLQYFSTDDSFSQVNEAFNGLLSNIISGADWGKLIGTDVSWGEIKSYVQDNIVDVFDGIDLSGDQANIKTLLSGGADLTVGTFNQVLNDVKATLMDATDNDKDLVKSIMSALEGAMAVTSSDVASIVDQAYKGIDGGSSSLELLKNRAEQWITAEKEFAEVSGESAESTVVETEAFNEFFDSIKSGNPTIAELQALIETTNDGSLEAAGSFAEWKQQYDECVKSFSNVKPYNDIVESFGTLKEVTDSAYESFVALNGSVTKEEYQSWEPDEYRNRSVETFNKLKALYDEGRVGTREFAQYKKYFELDDMEEVGRFIQEQADYYVEGKEGLENWLSRIYDMNRSGDLAPDLASVEFLSDGKASFNFDVKRINEIAEALHMTEEQVWNFIRATRAYSESWESMSAEDLFEDFDAHGLFSKTENGFSVLYEDIANYTGLSREEIDVLIDKLNELDQFGGKLKLDLGLAGELEAAGDQLEKIDQVLRSYDISSYFDIDEGIFTVTQNMIDGMLRQLSPENVKQYIMQWSKISGVVIPAGLKINTESVDELLKNVASDGADVETHTVNHVESEVKGAEELEEFYTTLNKIQQIPNLHKRISLTVSQPSSSTLNKITSSGGSSPSDIINRGFGPLAFAEGTKRAPAGPSLLGDEASPTGAPRPELVVSGGEAYLAGVNGPTIGYLKRGDQVYTYSQTKKILGNNKNLKRIPAFSTGIGNFSYRGSIGAGSLWSNVASSSNSSAGGSDFESLYKYHQHLLKMEQESQKDYLNWLNKAYKDAYARGEIELDDYYKYQEEIFDLIRELVQDNLDDAEHYIDMLGHYDGNEKQIIAIYKDLMSAIEKEIASARAAGLTDNDEYLQNLQTQWWSYYDEITDIQDKIADNAKDAVEDLVDLRVKMIKQDLKNEKDALKEKKSALKDFYDAQKEMLQDQYDEEEYLDEQAEKRKAVTDLEMQLSRLSNDDSAWAQKKRLQLESDLSDARKELQDFEKQHALETAQDQIDKAYEIEEKGIDDQIDLIEDKEDNAKALREQALADLRSADEQMYKDMIEWNAKYGSGIDQDITDAWTEATKAMSEYFKLNQKYYEDINITQGVYPEFAPKDNGSWSTNPISGDNPNNKTQKPSQGSTPSSSKAGSVSNIGPQLQYGSRGSNVSALQTALKEMGLYSDKIDGHFGPNTKAGVMAFQRQEGISVDGIVGPNTKAKFKKHGYASGTSNALAGLHEIWEEGSEYIFTSSNGKKYRMFSGGEKVLNADATNFLYDFANSGGKVLETIVSKLMNGNGLPNVNPSVYSPVVNMGDLIIQGSASDRTVSEIRRAQREQVDFMLKEFKKLRP